jgi:spermidine synthase
MSPRRFLPALFLLFVGSGCAALIYEIVWFQLLQLVIGSSSISLGILLGTFMGGMCIGSLLLARLIAARQHPLRVYAALELGIGVLAIAILAGMPLVGGIYTAWAGEGVAGIVFRAIVAGICLLPPTILMGATLPAISRWVTATPDGVSWPDSSMAATSPAADRQPGRRLLPAAPVRCRHGDRRRRRPEPRRGADGVLAGRTVVADRRRPGCAPPAAAAACMGRSRFGMTALAARWSGRGSSRCTSAPPSTPSRSSWRSSRSALASAAPSARPWRAARRRRGGRSAGASCLVPHGGWAAYQLTESLPCWPINPYIATTPWFTLQLDLVRCMWVTLPAAMLWREPARPCGGGSSEPDAARLAAASTPPTPSARSPVRW